MSIEIVDMDLYGQFHWAIALRPAADASASSCGRIVAHTISWCAATQVGLGICPSLPPSVTRSAGPATGRFGTNRSMTQSPRHSTFALINAARDDPRPSVEVALLCASRAGYPSRLGTLLSSRRECR
ncbi:MAG: hypothetical protein H3C62_06750 [Gemmatimonadaceae bacterium]|nr:hypothetical protein [Gemmatimonadaceae bacterium]